MSSVNIELPKTQNYRVATLADNYTTENNGISLDSRELATQVHLLNKRVTNLEGSIRDLTLSMSRLSGEGAIGSDDPLNQTRDSETSGDRIKALSVIDPTLVTSLPFNATVSQKIKHVLVVFKWHKFAMLQCLLIVFAIAFVVGYGVIQFLEAQSSTNETFKPFKMDAIDDYYLDESLIYEQPLNYIYFQLLIPSVAEYNIFYSDYQYLFDEPCDSALTTCMESWIRALFEYSLSWQWMPYCLMENAENDDIAYVFSRNLTVYVEETVPPLGLDVWKMFFVTIKQKFNDFDTHISGKTTCELRFDLDILKRWISPVGFVSKLEFMVSRENYTSGLLYYGSNLRSIKSFSNPLDWEGTSLFGYSYEEKKYDGTSVIIADLFHEGWIPMYDPQQLVLFLYPLPSVEKYVSYNRYSYGDWLADVGGFFSLSSSFFIFLVHRLSKLANRKENFLLRHGILPSFSLQHRNAEEIAGLRSITMAGMRITEEDYFPTQQMVRTS